MPSTHAAIVHWTLLALEATLDTLQIPPITRISLLELFRNNLLIYLGDEDDEEE
ncbi:MAG: hypothetical protein KatS3mg071_1984 [Meiothermus sp.]|nr:MAG: hypothetical protein KatS3mg071_1984 [Meiothermus sp.]